MSDSKTGTALPEPPSPPDSVSVSAATLTHRRTRALLAIALVVLLVAVVVAAWWGVIVRWRATTSDAYVGADIAQISALTAGMSIVPLGGVWVDANFKETEFSALRVGQPVTLTADAFGSAVVYRGKVAGVAPATGSTLSLLPAQNATGNWIKVVQRVPARIWLEPGPLATYPLQVGLSMNVTVDLHDQSGPRLGLLPQAAQPARTTIYDDAARDADARVAAVIAANAGR